MAPFGLTRGVVVPTERNYCFFGGEANHLRW